MMRRVTRRGALQAGAATAAVLGAASAVQTVQAISPAPTADLVHTGACFHRTWRAPHDTKRAIEVADRLQALMSPEVRALYIELDTLEVEAGCNEQVQFVEELARHFPGMAPAIRAIAFHHNTEPPKDWIGACCLTADTIGQ